MAGKTPLRLMLLLVAVTAAASGCSKKTEITKLSLRPCVVQSIAARCGSLAVLENPARPDGRHIRLRVVVIPARQQPAAPDAFTYLSGGPGGASASGMVSSALTIWDGVHERHDIVLVDQRGTGLSHALECPATSKSVATDAKLKVYIHACLASLAGDPVQYGTKNAMDDLDSVRAALGYKTFDVYGTSYGATAAQVYLMRHPRSVRAMILDGATRVDIPFFSRFAVNGARALDQVAQRCAAEPACASGFPGWRQDLTSLIARWNAKPVNVEGAGNVTGDGLAGVIQSMTVTDQAAALIPYVVSHAAAGDYAPLGRQITPGGTSRLIMYWSIMCNEPWVGLDAAGRWGTYLDGYTKVDLAQYAMACRYIPARAEPAADWRLPHSDVPLLALVGGADPQDSIANLAGLHTTFPNSRTIVVPGLGHAIGQYGCLGELVGRFVDRGTAEGLNTQCVRQISPTPFVLSQ